ELVAAGQCVVRPAASGLLVLAVGADRQRLGVEDPAADPRGVGACVEPRFEAAQQRAGRIAAEASAEGGDAGQGAAGQGVGRVGRAAGPAHGLVADGCPQVEADDEGVAELLAFSASGRQLAGGAVDSPEQFVVHDELLGEGSTHHATNCFYAQIAASAPAAQSYVNGAKS